VAVGHQKYIQKPQQNEFKQQTVAQFQKALAFLNESVESNDSL